MDDGYAKWVELHQQVTAAVSCPRCKAAKGEGCDWGTGHTSSTEYTQAHTPRVRKAGLK